jgi:hypothetical protein
MASVRVAPAFTEQGILLLTFEYDGTIVYDASYYDGAYHNSLLNNAAQGVLVELVSDSTVGLGTDAHYPIGKLIKVEPNACTVEVAGTIVVPYNASNSSVVPLVGRGIQVDGYGYAKTPTGGARLATERGIVLSVDSTNHLAYVLLPAAA